MVNVLLSCCLMSMHIAQGNNPVDEVVANAWSKYYENTDDYCGTVKSKAYKDGKVVMDSSVTCCALGKNRLIIVVNNISGEEELFAINTAYTFSLSRKTAKADWKLLTQAKQPATLDPSFARVMKESRVLKSGALQVYNNFILDIVSNKNTKFLGSSDGSKTYDYEISGSNAGIIKMQVEIGKQKPFLVNSYIATISAGAAKGDVTSTIDYWQSEPYDMPKTVKEKHNLLVNNQATTVEFERNYSKPNTKSGSDDEFFLTHYGIVEPKWLSRERSSGLFSVPWYLYITIAGIVCVVSASFLLYRKGRKVSV